MILLTKRSKQTNKQKKKDGLRDSSLFRNFCLHRKNLKGPAKSAPGPEKPPAGTVYKEYVDLVEASSMHEFRII